MKVISGHKTWVSERISKLPNGYSEVWYKTKKYSVVKTVFTNGKSVKVYAKELGGIDFISFNYYIIGTHNALKPCEMPEVNVLDFLRNYTTIQ